MNESVNVITDDVNNNVVNVIVNNSFGDQAIVDTGSYLSFVDNNFCKKHNLRVTPLQPGESKSYIAAGETRITAIGSTNLELTFAGEKFVHNFQIIKNLSTNILIGVNFIRKYKCVAYLAQGVFTLEDARVTVPLVVKGETLGLAKLKQQVTLQPNTQQIVSLICPKINNQKAFLLEPIVQEDGLGFCLPRTILSNKGSHYCQVWNPTDDEIILYAGTFIGQLTPVEEILSIAQENAPAADIDTPCYITGEGQGDYTGGFRNKHRRYSTDRIRASQANFESGRNNGRMQNSYSKMKVLHKMKGGQT